MRKQYRLLTPERAWKRYGNGTSVEFFITDYFYEGYTDIWEMCKKYIHDVICDVDGLVTVEERTRVAKFFYQYIKNYVNRKGGIDKLEIFSRTQLAQLDVIWNDDLEGLLNGLKQLEKGYTK